MSAGFPLPKTVFGHGFVMDNEGKKMSKSVGNVVDPFELLESHNADVVRFFLIRQAPYGKDIKFSKQDLTMVNNELADKFGNYAQRCYKITEKFCAGKVPSDKATDRPFELSVYATEAEALFKSYKLDQAAYLGIKLIGALNEYLQDAAPWAIKGKSSADEKKRNQIIRTCLEGLYIAAHFLEPFMPMGCGSIFEALGTPATVIVGLSGNLDNLKPGTPVTVAAIMFPKLELDGAAPAAKKAAAPKAAAAPAATASASSAEAKAITASYADIGATIKAKKTAGEAVTEEVGKLTALKEQYEDLTGEAMPGQKPSKKLAKKLKAAKNAAPAKAKAEPAAAPATGASHDSAEAVAMTTTYAEIGAAIKAKKAAGDDVKPEASSNSGAHGCVRAALTSHPTAALPCPALLPSLARSKMACAQSA